VRQRFPVTIAPIRLARTRNATAGAWTGPPASARRSAGTSLGRMGDRSVSICWVGTSVFPSVAVNTLLVRGVPVPPGKADPELVIAPDAVLRSGCCTAVRMLYCGPDAVLPKPVALGRRQTPSGQLQIAQQRGGGYPFQPNPGCLFRMGKPPADWPIPRQRHIFPPAACWSGSSVPLRAQAIQTAPTAPPASNPKSGVPVQLDTLPRDAVASSLLGNHAPELPGSSCPLREDTRRPPHFTDKPGTDDAPEERGLERTGRSKSVGRGSPQTR
jgi:hypothetical protein